MSHSNIRRDTWMHEDQQEAREEQRALGWLALGAFVGYTLATATVLLLV